MRGLNSLPSPSSEPLGEGLEQGPLRLLFPELSGPYVTREPSDSKEPGFFIVASTTQALLNLMGTLSTLIYFQPSKLFSNLLFCSEITLPLQVCFRLKDREVTLVNVSLRL